jgi:hypothetical protein
MVRTLLEDEEETAPLRFIGSANYEDGVRPVLDAIRRFIGVDHRILRRESSPEAAFTRLRTAVEAAGVFVLLVGNLGSHHTALDTSAFRGFALADPLAPFIVINDRDAKSAWSFTLLPSGYDPLIPELPSHKCASSCKRGACAARTRGARRSPAA